MKKLALFLAFSAFFSCEKDEPKTPDPAYKSGGETTAKGFYSDGFEQPSSNLNAVDFEKHAAGDAAFEATFVTSGNPINPGLGPLFNQNACVSCHAHNGRAPFPASPETDLGGLLLRLSVAGAGSHGQPLNAPGFGDQLQNRAIFGQMPESQVSVAFQNEVRKMLDGTEIELRQPVFSFKNEYVALPSGLLTSPRIAPSVFGLGLLEAIPEADLLKNEDPIDHNNDGISGRANRVFDALKNGQNAVGRFGWKAGQPSVLQQTAAAYNGDMGLTSYIFPNENDLGQPQHDGKMDDPEISIAVLEVTTFYTQSLAVPAPRDLENDDVVAGRALFSKIGCAKCHVPSHQTGLSEHDFLQNQTIWPYTDLLLHDMGAGLADGREEFLADGQEWRTPPLWGIGLTKIVNGHTDFLHDGRARNLTEAILWHGGEGEKSRSAFEKLTATERGQVVRFLEAL